MRIKAQGKTIVYTGDISFSSKKNLVGFAKNADLLICESSLLQEQSEKAKSHLTAFQAGEIAKEANVKQLLITHFWPEIDKRKYLKEAKLNFSNTKVAVEGKKIKL